MMNELKDLAAGDCGGMAYEAFDRMSNPGVEHVQPLRSLSSTFAFCDFNLFTTISHFISDNFEYPQQDNLPISTAVTKNT